MVTPFETRRSYDVMVTQSDGYILDTIFYLRALYYNRWLDFVKFFPVSDGLILIR